MTQQPGTAPESGGIGALAAAFGRLGLTSFGGPTAHLGYFREAFVEKRHWLTDRAYADLVALCQFLPGPASSQVGMAVGLRRAGLPGLGVAWLAFTLPSAIVLTLFALGLGAIGDLSQAGWLHGLKAAAVAVVAHAVMGMAKNLTPDARRATIAVAAMIVLLLVSHPAAQVAVMVLGGLAGLALIRPEATPAPQDARSSVRLSRGLGIGALVLFVVLLVGLPVAVAATGDATLRLVDIFYRSGSLVFGGGHVVLPLLETELVPTGLVDHDTFLAGYGAAQAVPGPLFTLAAFLGASMTSGPTGVVGATIALLAIFLPAALLVIGVLPFWEQLRTGVRVQRVVAGVNAVVVGILAAALYDPVFTAGVTGPASLAVAVACWLALAKWQAPSWAVVIGAAVVGFIVL
ncbi:chromate efflux transporter [Parenemella sanctibonifatiensis]|uniref:Chromate transporter n=1 Tax=Parenemella sanctibonifatiensis TaxID=2016505 RepID=A0A255EER3_9ACTN|nr:chromate efflux transporter [Parenemella sanctibonifatiensis]OYN87892.1 chromate transporter [Parenemella sanctibonifatiensis]